jgi:hypothetical protein
MSGYREAVATSEPATPPAAPPPAGFLFAIGLWVAHLMDAARFQVLTWIKSSAVRWSETKRKIEHRGAKLNPRRWPSHSSQELG